MTDDDSPLLGFGALARRLRVATGALGALTLVGAVVDATVFAPPRRPRGVA